MTEDAKKQPYRRPFVERYGTWDVVTFMQQLGLMPGPGGKH